VKDKAMNNKNNNLIFLFLLNLTT